MGVDLALLPFDGDSYSSTVLECDGGTDFVLEINTALGKYYRDVPEYFNAHWGTAASCDKVCHGRCVEDRYGEPVRYVLAKHLKKFKNHPDVQESFVNRAIWAYLEELPDDHKVALFWH